MQHVKLTGLLLMAAVAFSSRAEVSPGEIHFAELNCAACHDGTPEVKARLASRTSPKLGSDGLRLTPQWLKAFISNPQGEKPGTLMPDVLHGLAAPEKAEAAEALAHYLISLQTADKSRALGFSTAQVNVGKELFHSIGCVACHAPTEPPKNGKVDIDQLAKATPPFVGLAKKYTVNEAAAFLREPLKSHPSGRMPAMNLSESEATAIATYLLREQVPTGPAQKIAGLHVDFYEGNFPQLPDYSKLTPKTSGIADNVSLKPAGDRKENFALRFRGVIEIQKDGEYTFYTNSDDGSRLYIDEKQIVDNEGMHGPTEKEGKITLKAGDHGIAVTFMQGGGGAELKAYWKAPDAKKEEIPAKVLFHEDQPMRPLGDAPFTVDNAKASKGKELFAKLNCGACHTGGEAGKKAKTLADLKGSSGGCLAATPPAGAPKFAFADGVQKELASTLNDPAALAAELAPTDHVRRTMSVLNCYACHSREKKGGPTADRRQYFTANGEVDMGDEGTLPPHLNGVGGKLKPEWLTQVLTNSGAVRPYMATRMPQFGEANVKPLVTSFEKADVPAKPVEVVVDETLSKHGQKLAGSTGMSCISCHTFGGRNSLGIPAIDLTTMFTRLRADWFKRYLLNPQSLRPGTRMPEFFPDGASVNKTVLGGDTDKQISALWSFFSRGKLAEPPPGLVKGKMELVVGNEPEIYRHFIQGGGSRAIGVGYPEKINLCYDANELRLAMLWQGPFIDLAKHRVGRGAGYEGPLGYNTNNFVAGAPLAVLDSDNSEWPKAVGRPAGYQFKGYNLDDKLRPIFRFTYNGMQVEDNFIPIAGDVDSYFKRKITIKAEKPVERLFFRAAQGKIEEKEGLFIVDGKVRIKLPGAIVRKQGDKSELLVPLKFQNNEAKIEEEITW